ncbi:MAG: response regulator [Pirellulaceae bacterium]
MTSDYSNQDLLPLRPGPPGTKPPHVLLIEDDDGMRDMLAEAFRRQGWKVTECVDGFRWLHSCVRETSSPEPAEYAESEPYNVVVSDVRMPNMSGLDVLRILCASRCLDVCPPTIFITAFGDGQTHEKASELGAAAVLDKPFTVGDLIEKVRGVTMARARTRKEKR